MLSEHAYKLMISCIWLDRTGNILINIYVRGLPYYKWNLFQKGRYHRSHTLNYKNGYAVPSRPEVGVGGAPIFHNQLSESELDELANFQPSLTYGQAKQAPPVDFVPAHVAWDKQVMNDWLFKLYLFVIN